MLSDRSRALSTAAAAFTAAAVAVALTVTGSAVATAATATGTTPASSGAAGIGTPVDFPGTTASAPAAETLISAGSTGFLHQRAGSNDLLWTRYDTGATVTAFTLSPRVVPANLRLTIPGEFGAGSDVVASFDWSTQSSVTLYDMGAGGAQSVVSLNGLMYKGTYGSTVVAVGLAGSAAGPGVHLLTPDGAGGTKDVLVTGLPAAAAGRATQVLAGDASAVVVQYTDASGYHQALVDLTSGAATPVSLNAPAASVLPAQVALSPTSIVFWAGGGSAVHVFSRSDVSAAPVAVQTPANSVSQPTPSVAEVGGAVLAVQNPRAAALSGGALTATPEAGGANTSLLAVTDDALLPTPDGGALIAGTTQGGEWGFYRVAPGSSGPAATEVTPLYRAPSPVAGLALERGTATVWSADSGTIWSRTLTGGAFGAPTRIASTGTAYGPIIATGDGQVVYADGGALVKAGSSGTSGGVGSPTGSPVDADGRYALSDSGALIASDFGAHDILGPVGAPAKPSGQRPGAVWGGFAYVGSGRTGAVTIEDLAHQRVAGVVDSGAPCVAPEVQVVGRWLYWTCDTHTAGILDMADGARYRLPASGAGYDDALLGDGFVVHHDATAGQLVLDDVHTDADASTTTVAALGGGTTAPDRDLSWTVDRYSDELGWHGDDNVFDVAPVVGIPASAAWTPTPGKAASVPAWVTPVAFTYGQGLTDFHECSGVLMAPIRVLATADCYTGHGSNSFGWNYNRSTGTLNGGGSNPSYLLDQRYNAATGQDDVSVTRSYDNPSKSVAVLAGASDGALYRPGTTATFYSWSTLGWGGSGGIRTPHVETVQLQSAATCAQLLGHALPSGSICTAPAPGAAWVAPQDQCTGDAGGALVAGGKVIATSATPESSCASTSVRVYTATAPKIALERGWSRDLGVSNYGMGFGGITAKSSDGLLTAFCSSDMHGCLNGGVGQLSDIQKQFNLVLAAGDMDGDGNLDLLIRSKSGALYRFWGLGVGVVELNSNKKTLLGTGWNQYTRILAPGDLTGDGITDVVAIDHSGVMWLYPGTANGGLGSRIRVSSGWNSFNLVAGNGDLTGDGIADLVARDSGGRLWTFVGDGHGGFQAHHVYVGSGWGRYNAVVLGGDLDGQGHEQLIGRLPNGQCYLYTSNGAGGFTSNGAVGGNNWERYAQLS
ncbi:FG-GAP-like repeat-containing protein [Streptacidiphilus anmyonensis]|uniref:FG-GAP-like repeat-containing protein n=1 Tax=Streptacidiphilus anmyonensis TaxID=405782 RepID=UPI0005AA1295|nr:FG-GAP-like repeat-containing protein [Streptacidiphilus anmyonensis]